MDKRINLKIAARTAVLVIALFAVVACLFADRAYADSLRVGGDAMVDWADNCAVIVADYDNCLTFSEQQSLIEEFKKASKKAHCNIGLVITKDLQGLSDREYAERFSDDNFGLDSNSVVLMLLNTYNKPEYKHYVDYISSSGSKKRDIDYNTQGKILDRIYKKLGSPRGDKYGYNNVTHTYGGYNYYAAGKEFARCVKSYGSSGFYRLAAKITGYITTNFNYFFIGTGIAVLIGILIVTSKVRGYKKKKPVNAAAYMDRSGTRITRQVDQFVREYTTHHTHSSSSGGGHHGGGGGHHTSHGGHHR